MLINHDRRFIFYHVPKTAGSSIRAALQAQPDTRRPPNAGKHMTPAEFARTWRGLLDWRLRRYFSFCFVRDPWERFGSLHRFLLRRPMKKPIPRDLNDFALALEDRAPYIMEFHSIRPQAHFADGVAFVGRYERLQQDFAIILKRLALPDVALGHKNASAEQYRQRMSARSEAIIAGFYREDIERFGYR
jgi:hypothetical protein